jgi:hypothetical protein
MRDAWQTYRAFAGHFLTVAFIIYVGAAVISAVLYWAFGRVGGVAADAVQIFANFLLQASLVRAVQDVRDGRADLSVGQTMQSVLPVLGTVTVAGILAAIGITVGLILIIVPGLWLITIWALIMPIIVIERCGVFDSFGRSRRLVRGQGWEVFGILVLLFIIQIAVSIVVGTVLGGLPAGIGSGLSSVIAGTLVAPLIAIAVTHIYYRLGGRSSDQPGGSASYGDYRAA